MPCRRAASAESGNATHAACASRSAAAGSRWSISSMMRAMCCCSAGGVAKSADSAVACADGWAGAGVCPTLPRMRVRRVPSSEPGLLMTLRSWRIAQCSQRFRVRFACERADQIVEIAIQDLRQLVQGQVDAVVGDAALRKIVRADALAAIAGTHLQLARRGLLRGLLGALRIQQPRLQQRQRARAVLVLAAFVLDRKSTRLNSSHPSISYAVFCLKKKKKNT